ncbi:MAG: LptF/LptG family permease [Elusimicrobia bacterium]|nr:LptF/LptG family permease [Elusimicrobiota bacterium]
MQRPIGAPLNILPRYCVRLFLPVFLLCLGVFTGVLLMNHFLRLFNLALLKGISLFWIAGCFARLLPYFLSLALPMAFLVAVLVTLGQLSEQGEIMALRASGFSFFDLTWPFLALALACSALLLVLNHRTAPAGFHSFRKQYQIAAQQVSKVELQPGSFLRLGPWKLYARRADPDTGRLRGVYLVRANLRDAGLRVSAREGLLTLAPGRSLDLELSDGTLQLPNQLPEKFTAGRFSRYRLSVPVLGAPQGKPSLDIPEITSSGLRSRIAEPGRDAQSRNEYRVELALRSAAALAPFFFFWIAAPLGLRLVRHGRGLGFAASLVVLMGYYGLIAVGVGVGRRHDRLSDAAPWLADAAALALGAALTRKAVSR